MLRPLAASRYDRQPLRVGAAGVAVCKGSRWQGTLNGVAVCKCLLNFLYSRMLTGIELAEAVDTQQGGKKQRLEAVQKRPNPCCLCS